MKRFLTAITLILALFGCGRMEGPVAEPQGPVTLVVTADRPDAIKTETRVALSGTDLVWEGSEALSVLFGAPRDTSGGPGGPRAILGSVSQGRFKGTVDLSTYSLNGYRMDDLQAISLPANRNCRIEYKSGKVRLAVPVEAMQVQHHAGVLNGDYLPFFAWVSGDQLRQEDGKYTIDGIQLRCGGCIVRYHIYGTAPSMASDVVFKSIAIQVTGKAINGTGYWYGDSFSSGVTGTVSSPITVRLEEACTAAGRTLENALMVYAVALPRLDGEITPVLAKITVTTDKGVYVKEVSFPLELRAGHILPMGIDLSTFTRTETLTAKTPTQLRRGYVDSLVFNSYPYFYNKPIKVYTYVPSGDISSCPVLFAMHGSTRTGLAQVATNWKTIATNKRIIVFAPCFDSDQYPSSYYQNGNVSWSTTMWNGKPHEAYTYNMIEAIFDYMKEGLGFNADRYDFWGHSAGGQFSHRFLLHMPEARAYRIVSSNAGYYTVPDPGGISDGTKTYGFPYSILGANWTREQLAAYFARNLVVHLGTADTASTVEQDSQLPSSPGAYAQGKCRYERGKFFYARAKAVADSLGLPFKWTLVEVKGVAHSSKNMTQNSTNGAGVLLYGK